MTDGPVPAPDHGDNFHEPIEHWGSAPGPRSPLIVEPTPGTPRSFRDTVAARMSTDPEFCAALRAEDEADHAQTIVSYGKQILKQHARIIALEAQLATSAPQPAVHALQSLITATGSHVTLGTHVGVAYCMACGGPAPCPTHVRHGTTSKAMTLGTPEPLYEECLAMQGPAPEEIPVTDEMAAEAIKRGVGKQFASRIYRAMAAVAPVELYGERERQLDAAIVRVADLEDEIETLKAKLATFGPATPADLPDPPRRADGTLAPVAKPLPVIKAPGDARRVGG